MGDPGRPGRVTAQRGDALRCRGWRQEGLLRMLENVLEIGERPEDLVVYAARGKAARDWESYARIVASLRHLGEDETLVVQSGKPVAVFPSSPDAPLVVMACGNVVGHYATPEYFDELCDRGLIMWGGLTAGDWQYIGFQGVLQGVYELLQAVGEGAFRRSLAGRFVLTAGLGGMGSAQPLAIAMAGGSGIVVEVDPDKCARALEARSSRLCDRRRRRRARVARRGRGRQRHRARRQRGGRLRRACRQGCCARCRHRSDGGARRRLRLLPCRLLARGVARVLRELDPGDVADKARRSMARQVEAMLRLKACGSVVFEAGNNLRVQAKAAGVREPSRSTGSQRGT